MTWPRDQAISLISVPRSLRGSRTFMLATGNRLVRGFLLAMEHAGYPVFSGGHDAIGLADKEILRPFSTEEAVLSSGGEWRDARGRHRPDHRRGCERMSSGDPDRQSSSPVAQLVTRLKSDNRAAGELKKDASSYEIIAGAIGANEACCARARSHPDRRTIRIGSEQRVVQSLRRINDRIAQRRR